MSKLPIIIVDDDMDDREFLQDAWKELDLDHPLIFCNNGNALLEYLDSGKTTPFLILCDVNIPKMDGFELKEKILHNANTKYKSIPFVFWSSAVSNAQVQKAYDLGVNGFFLKENNLESLKQSLIDIVRYWSKSKTPE
jgi:CheY-like chemotaxis protein